MGGSRGKKTADLLVPPPDVRVCGKRVPPDADPAETLGGKESRRGGLKLGKGPAEVVNYPATCLLLAINLAFAYHLWAKRVRVLFCTPCGRSVPFGLGVLLLLLLSVVLLLLTVPLLTVPLLAVPLLFLCRKRRRRWPQEVTIVSTGAKHENSKTCVLKCVVSRLSLVSAVWSCSPFIAALRSVGRVPGWHSAWLLLAFLYLPSLGGS